MQRQLKFKYRSEDEEVKEAGLYLDFDEIAKKGSLTKEEGMISKWYGIYGTRLPGNYMARIVVPGGVITAAQGRVIADVSEKYAQGKVSVTTRQSIQLHWLKAAKLADLIRELRKENLSTFHGCGDVTRNVTACPLAETCQYRRINVRSFAKKCAKYLTDARDLDNLPRKFKVNWSGCEADCAQPYINCIGISAVKRQIKDKKTEDHEIGFKVVIGGGMGWKPFVAQELFTFVPEDQIIPLTRAIAIFFRDNGDRYNRSRARLKFVINRLGVEKSRKEILKIMKSENMNTGGLETKAFAKTGPEFPARPLTDNHNLDSRGKGILRIRIPKGEMDFKILKTISAFSELYADQRIYTTNRQNLELHGIEPEKMDTVRKEIEALGVSTDSFFGLKDIVSCVGTTYCPKAVSKTRDLFDALYPIVSRSKYKSIHDQAIINITGCPNSCSPYRIADLGFRGMRIREESGSVEGYEMLIGGTQEDFGRLLGQFKLTDCPKIVEKVLDKFIDLQQNKETLSDCVKRVGVKSFQEVIE